MNRWWIYQRERFPVVAHGALIGAFSLSAVCYSRLQRGVAGLPEWRVMLVAFVSSFLFFLQLRIADEFKDAEEDARHRPYRPVPRGLVRLEELGWIAWVSRGIQLGLACWLTAALVPLLAGCWAYMALMSREFFAASWLKARPVHYLWSHMLVLPLIDFYVTACDWMVEGPVPPGLMWLLAITFFNGLALEIGRKLRAPADEEPGVETYSGLWGIGNSLALWLAALCSSAVFALIAARSVRFERPMMITVAVLFLAAVVLAAKLFRRPEPGSGKAIEAWSGIWGIGVYLLAGLAPALARSWR